MNAYKKYITIEDPNHVVLSDLPFKPGQRVEVIILAENSKRAAISEELRDLLEHKMKVDSASKRFGNVLLMLFVC